MLLKNCPSSPTARAISKAFVCCCCLQRISDVGVDNSQSSHLPLLLKCFPSAEGWRACRAIWLNRLTCGLPHLRPGLPTKRNCGRTRDYTCALSAGTLQKDQERVMHRKIGTPVVALVLFAALGAVSIAQTSNSGGVDPTAEGNLGISSQYRNPGARHRRAPLEWRRERQPAAK